MKYGDVVVVVADGHQHDRAVGRVGQFHRWAEAAEVNGAAVVEVTLEGIGVREFPREALRVFGLSIDAGALPAVGDMVELLVAFPDLHIARGQLARVIEVGEIPGPAVLALHRAAVNARPVAFGDAGYRLDAAGRPGHRVRGWVTADMIHRLGARVRRG